MTRLKTSMILGLLVLILLFSAHSVMAYTQLPEIVGYVTDAAAMLTEGERMEINQLLERYDRQTGNQVIVVTIPTLDRENIESYSMRLAQKVKPGQKGKDNGAILLIIRDDRKIRIEVGYGLEGTLTDGRGGSIIRNGITPAFREGHFSQGIRAGVAGMIHILTPEFKLDAGFNPPPIQDRSTFGQWIVPLFFFIIIILTSGQRESQRRRRWRQGGFGSGFGPIYGNIGRGIGDSGKSFPGGGFSGGGGRFGGGGSSGSW